MKDKIYIKAINTDLIWNYSILDILDKVCYNIDFTINQIEIFLSRGEFISGIEFDRAKIGIYNINEIGNTFFNKISFELITPENNINKSVIEKLTSEQIDIKLSNNILTIEYKGNNPTIESINNFILPKDINLNNIETWEYKIEMIRSILKSEYRFYSYDYNYLNADNYGWLSFKDISIFELRGFNFRAYFHYNGEGIISIETIIGHTISDYKKVENHLIKTVGLPKNTETNNSDSNSNHILKKTIWLTDNFEIKVHSTYIARSEPEQFRYELEIRKTEPNNVSYVKPFPKK